MELKPWLAKWGLGFSGLLLSLIFSVQGHSQTTRSTILTLGSPNLTGQAGRSVTLGMRFDAVPLKKNYRVFLHFVDSSGATVVNGDHSPSVPTSTWNGAIRYNRSVTLPSILKNGVFSIYAGLYDAASPLTRVALNMGSGVTADHSLRYKIGTLNVGASAPTPDPANYTITIASPSAGATVSGSVALKGSAPGMKNLEVMSPSRSLLARSTPDSAGNFTATVDTTKLANGSQTLTVEAWDSAAGQSFTRTDRKTLSLNVQNNSPAPAPAPSAGGSTIPRPGSLTGLTATGPVTLQSNRTYSGLRVTNPNGRCFVGNNVTNVRITNSEIGPCGNGTDSEQLGIGIYDSSNIRIDHNIIHDVATGLDAVRSTGVVFSHNYVYGIRGPMPSGQAVQYENIRGRGNKILCNIIANAESAGTEDNVSLWMSNGDPVDPIEIAYNRVRGGHSRTGSGIIIGDGNGSGNVDVHDNTVVNVNNAGIGVASGQNLKIRNNRIYNNGTYTSVGLSVRNWYDSCNNVQVTGNRVWAFDRVWNASPTEWHYLNNGTCSNVTESGNIFGDTSLSAAIFDEEYPQCQ